MSGYTFKVGDRVRVLLGGVAGAFRHERATVNGCTDGYLWVTLDIAADRPITVRCDECEPLPLFEPVERWMILKATGTLGAHTFTSCPGDRLAGTTWVKVIISPAEDQS